MVWQRDLFPLAGHGSWWDFGVIFAPLTGTARGRDDVKQLYFKKFQEKKSVSDGCTQLSDVERNLTNARPQ